MIKGMIYLKWLDAKRRNLDCAQKIPTEYETSAEQLKGQFGLFTLTFLSINKTLCFSISL